MRHWWCILTLSLLLLACPIYADVASSGRYYSGSTFNLSGGTFTVLGVNSFKVYNNVTDDVELYYKSVLIQSNIDSTVQINNGTCRSTSLYTYCYSDGVIDMSNTKTFTGDYLQPLLGITVSTQNVPTVSINVNRDTNINSYCGQMITVPITISSVGMLSSNVTYIEELPDNTVILSTDGGDVKGNIITMRDRFGGNMSKNYSYTLSNIDCLSKTWNGQYVYTSSNGTVSKKLNNFTLTILPSYIINESEHIKTNSPYQILTYNINTSNLQTSTISINLDIWIPSNVDVLDESGNVHKQQNNHYSYYLSLPSNTSDNSYINFKTKNYGTYYIYTNGVATVGDKVFNYNHTITVETLQPEVVSYIDVNVNKSTNKSLYVMLMLKNYDLKNIYYNVYGNYKDNNEEPLVYSTIAPDTEAVMLERSYNFTNSKNLTVSFDGVYRDFNGNEKKLHAERILTVNTLTEVLNNISGNSTNTYNISNQQQNPINTNLTVPAPIANKTATNSTGTGKDFITSILEGINNFLQSIFG